MRKHLVIGQLNEYQFFNQQHTSGITVYKGTVTNIENTVRAVHSCNSWLETYPGLLTISFSLELISVSQLYEMATTPCSESSHLYRQRHITEHPSSNSSGSAIDR